jgi:hypothetical protein
MAVNPCSWRSAGTLPDNRAAIDVVTSAFVPQPGTVTTRHDPAGKPRRHVGR